MLALSFLMACFILSACYFHFRRQNSIMEEAVLKIETYLSGDTSVRIACDEEGEIYRLFHSVNTLASVLNAHAENECRAKESLRNTISDISHQLKTPLAALNIYNGLLQDETEMPPQVQEFAALSEQELDRMERLVENLLKITKLDAGIMTMKKSPKNVADMMRDIALHFEYRARLERKEVRLFGADDIMLLCDRDWMMEAVSNLVKNALDHTAAGGIVHITWKRSPSLIQFTVKDNGSGIHPEDLHHIFKRFYRSRFSQDTQGAGLGLSLAKAIVEAHGGSIAVDSVLGHGSAFAVNFLI